MRTRLGFGGTITAPHHLAAEAGAEILRAGGNAVEAMVAAAAAIAVVYPHMNAIGGDGFWIVAEPGRDPVGIDACGAAAAAAARDFYRERGHAGTIPSRGPLAALTAAGTISGWAAALDVARPWGTPIPLADLLGAAVDHARDGVPVTPSQQGHTAAKLAELRDVPGFAETFLAEGAVPRAGARLANARLAATLEQLGTAGLDDFYRGDLARSIAADLAAAGSPLALADLESHRARRVTPLAADLACGRIWNMPPPTQGLASLMILAIFERLAVPEAEGFDHLHGLIEATKQAFLIRDAHVTDPAHMTADPASFLAPDLLAAAAARVDRGRALPWPQPASKGDTIWMGAIDAQGRAVSFIQSIYWEFGSGVVLPQSGILWQNRGISFGLTDGAPHPLRPGRKPFHTLNPAFARLKDGRTMVYGTMGGEGQPQTQAALFSRYAMFGQDLQDAISAPRWLLGRTWGAESTTLKLEDRFDPVLVRRLRDVGHAVETAPPLTDLMGHAGAVVRHATGLFEGATDPRSDGAAVAL